MVRTNSTSIPDLVSQLTARLKKRSTTNIKLQLTRMRPQSSKERSARGKPPRRPVNITGICSVLSFFTFFPLSLDVSGCARLDAVLNLFSLLSLSIHCCLHHPSTSLRPFSFPSQSLQISLFIPSSHLSLGHPHICLFTFNFDGTAFTTIVPFPIYSMCRSPSKPCPHQLLHDTFLMTEKRGSREGERKRES